MTTISERPVDALGSHPYKTRYDNFIGGKWVAPVNGKYFDNVSPVTGKKMCEIARDHRSAEVVPRTIPNAVPGIHSRFPVGGRSAEIGSPGSAAGPRRSRELLAMSVGARDSAKIGAIPAADTGDEERHRRWRLLLLRRLSEHRNYAQCEQKCFHAFSLNRFVKIRCPSVEPTTFRRAGGRLDGEQLGESADSGDEESI